MTDNGETDPFVSRHVQLCEEDVEFVSDEVEDMSVCPECAKKLLSVRRLMAWKPEPKHEQGKSVWVHIGMGLMIPSEGRRMLLTDSVGSLLDYARVLIGVYVPAESSPFVKRMEEAITELVLEHDEVVDSKEKKRTMAPKSWPLSFLHLAIRAKNAAAETKSKYLRDNFDFEYTMSDGTTRKPWLRIDVD